MQEYTKIPSPLGEITLAAEDGALAGLWFSGQAHYMRGVSADARRNDALPLFRRVRDWLDAYFAGRAPDPAQIPLTPAPTAFQARVRTALLKIPYGETVSYGELAQKLGAEKKTSPRAVGTAVGRNPVSVLVPCHRVVGKDGGLTGYAGGTERKSRLLELERETRHKEKNDPRT